jgi:N-carbamoylputrescine amidase
VPLLQLTAQENDQEANLRKGLAYCRRAADLGADLALFPEMWNIGYSGYNQSIWDGNFDPLDPSLDGKKAVWQGQAISVKDDYFGEFMDLAKELEMAIALTYLEKWPGQPRNSVSIINRRGEVEMTYAKVHTTDFSLEGTTTPGKDFHVCQLETAGGTVMVGSMICFDREFPESARILMLKGAEIIVTPNACELEANRIGQFRARAFENMVGMAMANYAAPQANGHSLAFDARAFRRDGRPRDPLIIEAGEEEGVYLAVFDMEAIRAYRQREVWGNAFRKPGAYAPLTSAPVIAPFSRKTAR